MFGLQLWCKVRVGVGILCLDSTDGVKVSVSVRISDCNDGVRSVSGSLCLDFHDGVRSVLVSVSGFQRWSKVNVSVKILSLECNGVLVSGYSIYTSKMV